ncbi:hypothetical protein [Brevibacterium zhoupengii]|uniref:hypothetical protein n=1 Tax=Brevibacterium zhoupengii TaxID=2898795 RepID=UPI001E616043|nr:hypothetical protein [Brevibacterium zhoupengii]
MTDTPALLLFAEAHTAAGIWALPFELLAAVWALGGFCAPRAASMGPFLLASCTVHPGAATNGLEDENESTVPKEPVGAARHHPPTFWVLDGPKTMLIEDSSKSSTFSLLF